MTNHTNRIAFSAPILHVDACNRAANALGRNGVNLSVPLSPTGLPPATHYGGSAVETDSFLAAVAAAPSFPEWLPWPDDLDPEDWQAVADHLTVVSAPAGSTNPREQFDAMLAAAMGGFGLKVVEPIEP